VTGDVIRNAVNALIATYRNEKRRIEVKTIPASSLWIEIGHDATTWRKLDAALAEVSKGPLGQDYTVEWLKQNADAIAALL